jgi:hypothetical protein
MKAKVDNQEIYYCLNSVSYIVTLEILRSVFVLQVYFQCF